MKKNLSSQRKRLFTLAAISIPFIFIGLLEIGLRVFNYSGDLTLFITGPAGYENYFRCNPNVGRRYFFMQNTVPDPQNDLFLKEKPQNGYRIFCVGGSTTAGYPYASNIMFPRILQERLSDVFPGKQIEVVNTAITAVNTYTVLDFIDEIIAQKADLVLMYAGHNEFYGALGAGSNESLGKHRSIVKLNLKLQRFKLFLLMRDLIGNLKKRVASFLHDGDVADPSATLMERMVANQTIPLHSEIYETGKQQFKGNLRDIVSKLQNAGVKVILSELVSNVKDMRPFISVRTDSLPRADEVFRLAKKYEYEEKFEMAKQNYLRAKDLDALRFRATEEFNEITREIGAEFDVPVAPVKGYFEKASTNGLVGSNLLLEHLHPNVDGYFLMADAFFDTIHQNRLIDSEWETTQIKPAQFYRSNWGFTKLDKAYADLRLRILKGGWPFKPKSTPNKALLNYQQATKIDSLAYRAWREDGFNLERAHVQLAVSYEKMGDFLDAFEEYKALTYITPFNSSPYLRAADMLIKARQLDSSVPFLLKSLKLEDTAFANKWLGQIYLDRGQTQEALVFLQNAAKMAPEDAQLVYNLSGAYALNRQYKLAMETLKELEKLNPDFPGAIDLKRQLEKL